MRKLNKYLALLLLVCAQTVLLYAQAPQFINYQAVARNSAGNVLASSSVAVRISVRAGSASGTVEYSERQTATTNAFGLFTCQIGAGNVISGTFAGIDWTAGDKYMQVELDPTGGSSYTDMGTTQLVSVPYSLYSQHAGTSGVADTVLHLPAPPAPVWTVSGNDIYKTPTNGFVGIGTTSPTHSISISDAFGGRSNIGDHGGWTGLGLANSATGPYNAVANGGTYLSFLYAANPTTSLTSKMLMDGVSNAFRPTNDNGMSLGANGSRWTVVYATNGTIQTSDERFKTNVANLNYGLSEVLKLRPVSYQWKDNSARLGTGTNLGFMAQELQAVVPDVIVHSAVEKDKETGKYPGEYADAYGVKYAEFIPILTKAIQEQQKLIEDLRKEIELLKNK